MKPDMTVNMAGMLLRNPVMTASGTFGYGQEFARYVDLERIGAFVTKGLSLKARAGNPTPRIVETPGGMLNAIGLQNVGIDAFIEKTKKIYPHIANQFPQELKPRLFTYIDYPPTIRRMLYTTNWIERLNKHIRKVIKNKNSFPSEVSAMNLIFLAIMNFETRVYRYPIYAVASL